MTILGVGNEGDSFANNFSSSFYQTACKDSLARGGIAPTDSSRHELKLSSTVSEIWVHGFMAAISTGDSTTAALISLYDTAVGPEELRILVVSNPTTTQKAFRASYWDGASYVTIGEFPLPVIDAGSTGFEFDFHYKSGSSGRFRFFVKRQVVFDKSGTFSASTFDRVVFGAPDATGYYYGSIIAADECTVGFRLDSLIPNITSSSSGWTNATVTNLADTTGAPAVNTGTLASTNTTGAFFLLNYENPSSFATIREARGVSVATAGLIQSGSGFTTLSLYVNSTTLGDMAFGTSFTSYQEFMNVDPATTTAWTNTSISNMTVGAITS